MKKKERKQAIKMIKNVFGEYEYVPIRKNEIGPIWNELKKRDPIDACSSLHIIEHTYLLQGKEFKALWEIGDDIYCPPFEISTKKKRKYK